MKCLSFKPIYFYPNLVHNPQDVTKKELKALKKRRELEKRLVIEAEKAGHSLSN